MQDFKELLEMGLKFHGHKCPAMPMGLRAGLTAMEKLGVSKAPDGQLMAIVELDENHCATCFADGVQVATGCTYGKGNITRTGYGKWGLTLIDKKTSRSDTRRAQGRSDGKEQGFQVHGDAQLRHTGVPGAARGRCPVVRGRDHRTCRDALQRRRDQEPSLERRAAHLSRPWPAPSAARWSLSGTPASRRQDRLHSLFRIR